MVRTSRRGRDNPGLTPGEDMYYAHASDDLLAQTEIMKNADESRPCRCELVFRLVAIRESLCSIRL